MNKLLHLPIIKIVDENPQVKTFYFPAKGCLPAGLEGSAPAYRTGRSGGEHSFASKPGQFVMLWVPGIDQKPFSVGYDDGKMFGLTIFKRGPSTAKLFEMKVGDRVGITGPFGTSFTINPNLHYIMVAGGYGAAPLGCLSEALSAPLLRKEGDGGGLDPSLTLPLKGEGTKIDFLIGSRDKNLLLFESRLNKIPNLKLHIATDDGSAGHKGYVTDLMTPLLIEEGTEKLVVTCGPELMEKKILDMCNEKNINCEISIERYMKCGFGVCGQCAVDPIGLCMCKEGPVVSKNIANQITEFGNYHRDKSGAIIRL